MWWSGTTASFLLCGLLLPAELLDLPASAQIRQRPVDPAVKRDGWWIRLNPQSKAETISWTFSEPGKQDKKPVTFTWRSTDPDNFDLPEAVRLVDPVSFSVTAEPAASTASFCVFHASHGVMLVEFSGSEKKVLNSQAREKGCTP